MLRSPFGPYEIIRRLGEGGMGQVYLAHDTRLNRLVALKVCLRAGATRPQMLARFQREARAAAALSHPGLCAVHEYDEREGIYYLCMAYIDGPTLARQMGTIWPEAAAAGLTARLAEAMAAAHAAGVIHRDLKPANIVLKQAEEPVIIDFGLARLLNHRDRVTRTGLVVGTPTYMSPEQVAGSRDTLTPATDIYSLGVILYELLAGRPPFEGSPAAVYGQILRSVPQPPSALCATVSPEMDRLCLRALAKKPEDRFPTMADFAQVLEDHLERLTPKAEGGAALPPPLPAFAGADPMPRRTGRGKTTKRLGWMFATGSVLVAFALGAWLFSGTRREEPAPPAEKPPAPKPSLRIEAAAQVEVEAGQTVGVVIDLKRSHCTGSVEVRVEDLPAGVRAPLIVIPADSDRGRLLFTVPRGGDRSEFNVRLVATAIEIRATAPLWVIVRASPATPSLSVEAPAMVKLEVGQTRTVEVALKRGHCPGPVELRAEGLPAEIRAPRVVIPAGTDRGHLTLTVDRAASKLLAAKSDFNLRLLATTAEAEATTSLRVLVQPRPVKLTVISLEQDMLLEAGETKNLNVQIAWENCLGPIELTLEGLPEGVTATVWRHKADAEDGRTPATVRLTVADDAAKARAQACLIVRAADVRSETAIVVSIQVKKEINNSLRMRRCVEPGQFGMGVKPAELGKLRDAFNNKRAKSPGESPWHKVEITRPFYLCAHTVTVGQFKQFVAETGHTTDAETNGKGWGYDEKARIFNPGKSYTWNNVGYPQTDEHPVVNVSWNDAVAFCKWLSKKEGRRYELPTEAEWEYACRAGTEGHFSHANTIVNLQVVANIADESLKEKNLINPIFRYHAWIDGFPFAAPVGSFRANAWGLYDMHGNVWQWCADGPRKYADAVGPLKDPVGPIGMQAARVLRGGSFSFPAFNCRSAHRHSQPRTYCTNDIGFRVVLRPGLGP